ncbi:MAG: bacillithiol biosynthesis cysteine-adding enzyme BshC [Bacteroidetes bacterium]|nr:bacillithiol biosynthesis cysteine-adding enzyme BshC [Bacteroidota bacterium]
MFKLSQIPFTQTNLVPPIVHDLLKEEELNFNKSTDRKLLVSTLQTQYKGFQIEKAVQENISSLLNENTFTVTTGHQLCLFGGPAYFIYKIVSTIKLARIYSEKYPEKKVVPVFWLASEDHDFEEVNHLYLFNKKIEWNREAKGAVGRLNTEGLDEVLQQIKGLVDNDIFEEAITEKTLSEFTRHWLNKVFGKYGLVIIDADDKELKGSFSSVIENEFKEKVGKREVEKANLELEKKYKIQVNPREINFFFLDDEIRERFVENDARNWEELLKFSPEKFSPNVIYRPLYQEFILPNVAYVGGPNELGYWFQLKGVFAAHNIPYPQLILRDSFLFVSAGQQKLMQTLGLNSSALFQSAEQLKKEYIQSKTEFNDAVFQSQVETMYTQLKAEAIKVDGSLEGTVEAEKAKSLKALEALIARIKKAEKSRHEIDLNKIDKLKNQLFPEGVFQERRVNFLEFYSKYGKNYFDVLMENANPQLSCLKVLEEE